MADMRYRRLGDSGLVVSVVGIGCNNFGRKIDAEGTRAVVDAALDHGVNLFDTADIYGTPHGASEELLGAALKGRRDDVIIATKFGMDMAGANGADLGARGSRRYIARAVEASLRRLGTDYIDLYQIHRNDHATPLEETLEALHDLVKAGKVRYLGASSMPAWEFAKALHLQRQHGWARFASMQHHYNLLAREEEREMIPLCLDEGVGTIIWSPLARGRLARPWAAAKSTARAETDGGYADLLYPALTAGSDRAIIDATGAVAAGRGATRAQVALAWLRSKPAVTAPLVGANTIGQIDDAVGSLTIELTTAELATLERPYTPRYDFQGISDEAALQQIRDQVPGYASAS